MDEGDRLALYQHAERIEALENDALDANARIADLERRADALALMSAKIAVLESAITEHDRRIGKMEWPPEPNESTED